MAHSDIDAEFFELSEFQVHIWPIRLDATEAIVARYAQLLAPDERSRAGGFRFEHLRHSFTLTRGAVRILLARYLNAAGNEVQLRYSPNGKPALVPSARLEFNVSRSADIAVLAVTGGSEIGIDVEKIRPLPQMRAIAKHFFCPEESDDLMSVREDARDLAFFQCWTRKEAYIKVSGAGLSAPLDGFRVSLRPGEPASILHIGKSRSAAAAWTMHELTLAPGYAAALAYYGGRREVRVFPISDPADLLTGA